MDTIITGRITMPKQGIALQAAKVVFDDVLLCQYLSVSTTTGRHPQHKKTNLLCSCRCPSGPEHIRSDPSSYLGPTRLSSCLSFPGTEPHIRPRPISHTKSSSLFTVCPTMREEPRNLAEMRKRFRLLGIRILPDFTVSRPTNSSLHIHQCNKNSYQ